MEATIEQLRQRSREAFASGRLVSPARENALAINVELLALNPDDAGASHAVMDLFPAVVAAAEQATLAKQFAEAERLLDLLARANPTSAAGGRMREQLVLARGTEIDRVAAAAQESVRAEMLAPAGFSQQLTTTGRGATAVTTTSTTPAPASAAPMPAALSDSKSESAAAAESGTASGNAQDAPDTDKPAARSSAIATPSASPAEPVASFGATPFQAPEILTRVSPDYPATARSQRLSGWVDLEFVINAEGRAESIRVVGAQPQNLFDRSAQRALTRWRFKPAQRNGAAEPAKSRTRINFSAT